MEGTFPLDSDFYDPGPLNSSMISLDVDIVLLQLGIRLRRGVEFVERKMAFRYENLVLSDSSFKSRACSTFVSLIFPSNFQTKYSRIKPVLLPYRLGDCISGRLSGSTNINILDF